MDLGSADLSGFNLSEANLSSANLRSSNLSSINLSSANMVGADLSYAVLSGADLSGTDLNSADLSDVVSGGISGSPTALPTDWHLIGGYLIGFTANLSDADLSNTDLRGSILGMLSWIGQSQRCKSQGANLLGADLGQANLIGVKSGGIMNSPDVLPSDWQLFDGFR